jgi:hypothetical protein
MQWAMPTEIQSGRWSERRWDNRSRNQSVRRLLSLQESSLQERLPERL